MARIELCYGAGRVPLDLGDIELGGVIEPAPPSAPSTEDLRRFLREPAVGPGLAETAAGSSRSTIVIPDRTRGRIWASYLPVILEELGRAGIGQEGVTVLVATGMHRPASRAELAGLIGPARGMVRHVRQHSIEDESDLADLGSTGRGTRVRVRSEVVDTDILVLAGCIGFHYFAGFTGGRKAVLPGVAALDAIKSNHRLALDLDRADGLHPGARSGQLAGNPVHEDMVEALGRVTPDRVPAFLVNLLAAGGEGRSGVVTGDTLAAHEIGCAQVASGAGRAISEKGELAVVSAGGYPRDIDLIQSHKALEGCYRAVGEGGTILWVAQCAEGVGSPSLGDYATRRGVAEIKRCLDKSYELHAHTALSLRRKVACRRVVMLCDLAPELVRSMGMIPAATPAEAVSAAREGLSSRPATYVFPQGGVTTVLD